MDSVGVCTGGGGAGVCGGESEMEMEDSLMGFGGGVFAVLSCLSGGGCGGANLGWSGMWSGCALEIGIDDPEPLEQVEGGFGGAIAGGFKRAKSSSFDRLFRSPMKSGGGIKGGGSGGAIEGGGGINISPSTRSGRDITDPVDKLSPLTEGKKLRTRDERMLSVCCMFSAFTLKKVENVFLQKVHIRHI